MISDKIIIGQPKRVKNITFAIMVGVSINCIDDYGFIFSCNILPEAVMAKNDKDDVFLYSLTPDDDPQRILNHFLN